MYYKKFNSMKEMKDFLKNVFSNEDDFNFIVKDYEIEFDNKDKKIKVKEDKDTSKEIPYNEIRNERVPYKCPICGGSGEVLSSFYHFKTTSSSSSEDNYTICRSCGGRGIIWS